MADDTTKTPPPDQQPQQVVVLDSVSQTQKAIAEAARIAEQEQKDEETQYPAVMNADGTLRAGGRYKVNGIYVNADGVPHKNQKD